MNIIFIALLDKSRILKLYKTFANPYLIIRWPKRIQLSGSIHRIVLCFCFEYWIWISIECCVMSINGIRITQGSSEFDLFTFVNKDV